MSTPPIHTAAPPMRWSPDGKCLILYVGGEDDGQLLSLDWTKQASPRSQIIGEARCDRDFEVSETGTRLAWVHKDDFNEVDIAQVSNLSHRRFWKTEARLDLGGEVNDLAWSGDGLVLSTVRKASDQFFSLFQTSLQNKRTTKVVSKACDIVEPRALVRPYVAFGLSAAGINTLVLKNLSTGKERTLAPDLDSAIVSVSPNGKRIVCLCSSVKQVPALVSFNIDSKFPTPIFRRTEPYEETKPTSVAPRNKEGVPVNTFVWKSGSKLVIFVHGGPHLCERPLMDARRQFLIDQGFTCAVVNYRGSSGFGRTYEKEEDLRKQSEDVATVARWLQNKLSIPPSSITIVGESSGASVAIEAAKSFPVGRLVLLSAVDLGELWPPTVPEPQILAFQGAEDPLTLPEEAKQRIVKVFGSSVFDRNDNSFNVMPNEGHQFRSSGAWARVFAGIASD
ncbi:MAG TPA: alpha/beta fold hydrolase [Fimbriimonadaceae bacterium]